jgi:Fe-S cluster biogenesis protein NfuA/nitrite reductase/ring-hydroxylating ferredoxin subunit
MSPSGNGTTTSLPSLTVDDFEALARKVDEAFSEVQALPTEFRGKALSLKSAIEEFHKVGLTHIVRTLKQDERGKELLFQLVDEPAVHALFSMHGLVRADLRTQVSRVIDMVRPYMQSHGGDVALVDVRNKVVYVELSGNCNGCSMSQVTLKNTVEETLKQQLPDILGVEVVLPTPVNPSGLGLVQLGVADPNAGWIPGPMVNELPSERPFAFSHDGTDILLLPSKQGLRAYRNACAHQGLPLDGGLLDCENGTITCPWHGFQFDSQSGECFSAPQCQLEPFPLRVTDQQVWVRPTTA